MGWNYKSGHNRGKGAGIKWLREHATYAGDDCLLWPFTLDDKGYPQVGYNGKTLKATRVMCELAKGPAPTPKHEAAHSCGNGHGGCINPNHLSWKTRAENQADRHQHGTVRKSGDFPRVKLLPNEVAEIRKLCETMKQKDIAAKFNIHPSLVSKINKGARWSKPARWMRTPLTQAALAEIRAAKGSYKAKGLMTKYGVSRSQIWRIQNGRGEYAHVR